jgi:Flp pilus assembly protein TadD
MFVIVWIAHVSDVITDEAVATWVHLLTMPRSSDSKLTAVELKAEGNKLFGQKKYDQAAIKFTKAIELDRSNAVLYSNRAACHLALKRFAFPHNINLNQTFDDF